MKTIFFILLFCVFQVLTIQTHAQMVFSASEQLPSRNYAAEHQKKQKKRSLIEVEEPFVPNVTDTYLPNYLQSTLQYFKNRPKVSCLDSKSIDYAISLTISGKYQDCYQYVESCLQENAEKVSIPLIIQGARCAGLNYQYEKAYQIYKKGLVTKDFNDDLASAYIIEFASLALSSNYSSEVDDIVNLHPQWTSERKNLAKGLIEYLGAGLPTTVSKKQVFDFVDQELSLAQGFYAQLLKNIRIANYLKDYQTQKAYDYLVQDAIQLKNPLDWWRSGYNILYAVANGTDFTLARNFYLAFLPFAHDRLTSLPAERNVYNYTQIYEEVCKDQMLQGDQKKIFVEKLNHWRSGNLSLDQLISLIQDSSTEVLSKSDVQSTLGSLLSIQGHYDASRAAYWKAHQRCAFNNRSHWGLVLLERRHKYQTFPEFADNEKFIEIALKDVKFPAAIAEFIPNYNSFPADSQRRIQFAARIWAPYIASMFGLGNRAYIKLPFELLSEVPNFEDMRDARIGPPDMPNYFYDNRLWDDVRGAGGKMVAADHDEVFQTVHGDYNLLGHEMAHQFHQYVSETKPSLNDCIHKLYENAGKRNMYADGYSKSAVAEYFAQGIGYYLIPATSPARYGTNVSWFQKNDPDFYTFMVSIDQANGDLQKISCPVAL